MTAAAGLVGDIGGTNARFALVDEVGTTRLLQPRTYHNADFPSAQAVISTYLHDVGAAKAPAFGVFSVAGPIKDGKIHFTNLDWTLSETGLQRDVGFRAARLVNDFAAQTLGAPRVAPEGLRSLGGPVEGMARSALAVVGPGTGFGVGALARNGASEMVMATEGGHVGFAPTDEVEVQVWRWLAGRHGRVSVERILSGPGLYELYLALGEIQGTAAPLGDEREVQAAADQGDALASTTVDRFCAILGSTAGDFALGMGARGGVFITGGVAVRLADHLAAGAFRDRFEAKGRFVDYMRAIPTQLILEPYAALMGAASLLAGLKEAA